MVGKDKNFILNTVVLSLEAQKILSKYLITRENLTEAGVIWDAIKTSWRLGGHLPIVYLTNDSELKFLVHIYLETLNSRIPSHSRYDIVIQVENDLYNVGFINYTYRLGKLSFTLN